MFEHLLTHWVWRWTSRTLPLLTRASRWISSMLSAWCTTMTRSSMSSPRVKRRLSPSFRTTARRRYVARSTFALARSHCACSFNSWHLGRSARCSGLQALVQGDQGGLLGALPLSLTPLTALLLVVDSSCFSLPCSLTAPSHCPSLTVASTASLSSWPVSLTASHCPSLCRYLYQ